MKRILHLAWRYTSYHKLKTTILVSCVTITLLLPIAAKILLDHYNSRLMARAKATPLVMGARGNRFDLVLKSLYFRAGEIAPITYGDAEEVRRSGLAVPIPIHARYTARRFPIIGTSLDYFDFRGLKVNEGTLPLRLGDVVIGSRVAGDLDLKTGDSIFSDQRNLYDISTTYPLKMHITGVLEESDSPDDYALFADVKTAWIIEGIGHGHQDLKKTTDPSLILDETEDNVVGSSAVIEYQEVTPENIASYHFHGETRTFPLSSVIVLPNDDKSATILKARINQSETRQMLVPETVVEELMGIVFKVKRFFDANFIMIAITTVLFLVLVITLSLRLRRNEIETMFKIGCSRMTVFWLQTAEIVIVFIASAVAATLLSLLLLAIAPDLVRFP